jgi:hypothetical protein
MGLPKFLQPCFPSWDVKNLDKTKDKKLIITQILNYGTEKDLEWLTKVYSKRDLRQVISKPSRGVWLKDVLLYWQKILGLKIKKSDFQKAILDINPHF